LAVQAIADRTANLCRQFLVAFFIGELRHHRCIIIILLQLLILIHRRFHCIHLGNYTLRLIAVVPESGSGHLFFKVGDQLLLQV
jgi:hypothetical protein